MSDIINGYDVKTGSTGIRFFLQFSADSDGTSPGQVVTGLTIGSFSLTLLRTSEAPSSVSLVALSSITADYAEWGFAEAGNGVYRVDMANSAWAAITGFSYGEVVLMCSGSGLMGVNYRWGLVSDTVAGAASSVTAAITAVYGEVVKIPRDGVTYRYTNAVDGATANVGISSL